MPIPGFKFVMQRHLCAHPFSMHPRSARCLYNDRSACFSSSSSTDFSQRMGGKQSVKNVHVVKSEKRRHTAYCPRETIALLRCHTAEQETCKKKRKHNHGDVARTSSTYARQKRFSTIFLDPIFINVEIFQIFSLKNAIFCNFSQISQIDDQHWKFLDHFSLFFISVRRFAQFSIFSSIFLDPYPGFFRNFIKFSKSLA